MTNKDFENLNLTQDDDLDQRLSEYANQDSLIDKLETKNREKPALDDMSFQAEVSKNWWIYALLFISASFTITLGIYMGLAPFKTETGLMFQTDIPHLFLALVYAVAFVTVTEFAFGLAKWLFFTREEKNSAQTVATVIMMIVAGFSIMGTGIAGGMVIASNIAFLTDFVEVPHQAQLWVVIAIPTLIIFYATCGTVYIVSSREARAKRMVREQQRKNDLNDQTRRQIIRAWGKEQVERAATRKFIEYVEAGKLNAGEAQAAIDAGLTLGQLEKKLNRDIDGDGRIGHRGNGQQPVYASETKDSFTPPSDRR